jgi:hypothetical protein
MTVNQTESTDADGWKAHSLGKPLPVDASNAFAHGWLRRKREGRPTLIYAEPGADQDESARIGDRIDL